jgi:hypothetical protein
MTLQCKAHEQHKAQGTRSLEQLRRKAKALDSDMNSLPSNNLRDVTGGTFEGRAPPSGQIVVRWS